MENVKTKVLYLKPISLPEENLNKWLNSKFQAWQYLLDYVDEKINLNDRELVRFLDDIYDLFMSDEGARVITQKVFGNYFVKRIECDVCLGEFVITHPERKKGFWRYYDCFKAILYQGYDAEWYTDNNTAYTRLTPEQLKKLLRSKSIILYNIWQNGSLTIPKHIGWSSEYQRVLRDFIPVSGIALSDIFHYDDYRGQFGIPMEKFQVNILPLIKEQLKETIKADYLEWIKTLKEEIEKYKEKLLYKPAYMYEATSDVCKKYIIKCTEIINGTKTD